MNLRELKQKVEDAHEDLGKVILFETDKEIVEYYLKEYIDCIVLLRRELDRALIALN